MESTGFILRECCRCQLIGLADVLKHEHFLRALKP
jgi:hypothetical protein